MNARPRTSTVESPLSIADTDRHLSSHCGKVPSINTARRAARSRTRAAPPTGVQVRGYKPGRLLCFSMAAVTSTSPTWRALRRRRMRPLAMRPRGLRPSIASDRPNINFQKGAGSPGQTSPEDGKTRPTKNGARAFCWSRSMANTPRICPSSADVGAAHAGAGRTSAADFGSLNATNQAYANRTVNKPRSAHEAAPLVTPPSSTAPGTGRAPSYDMPLGSAKRAPENF